MSEKRSGVCDIWYGNGPAEIWATFYYQILCSIISCGKSATVSYEELQTVYEKLSVSRVSGTPPFQRDVKKLKATLYRKTFSLKNGQQFGKSEDSSDVIVNWDQSVGYLVKFELVKFELVYYPSDFNSGFGYKKSVHLDGYIEPHTTKQKANHNVLIFFTLLRENQNSSVAWWQVMNHGFSVYDPETNAWEW